MTQTAFVSISFAHRDALAAELNAISATLESLGWRAHVFVYAHTFTPDQAHTMMATTQAELRAADLLVAEVSHKAIGVGIEVGYAAALGLPVIYVRHTAAEPSTTVGGIATRSVVYTTPDDLRHKLTAAITQIFN